MAEYRPTPAQQQAMEARGCDLAVSAAAGSGKTAVLTRRIASLLAENRIHAAKLAVVTFSKAAAEELRDRLGTVLSELSAQQPENKVIADQLLRLSGAKIATIHSFCFSLIRNHKKELNLSEAVRIADPAEAALLLSRAISEAEEAFLKESEGEEREAREALLRLFGKTGREGSLAKAIQELREAYINAPEGLSLMEEDLSRLEQELCLWEQGKMGFAQTAGGALFCQREAQRLQTEAAVLDAALEGFSVYPDCLAGYGDFLTQRRDAFLVCAALMQQGAFPAVVRRLEPLLTASFPTVRNLKGEELEVKTLIHRRYDEAKKALLSSLRSDWCRSEQELLAEFSQTRDAAKRLLSLVQTVQRLYTDFKAKRDLLDYNDLEQLALRLVAERKGDQWIPSPLLPALRRDLDAIFVDEYQDTNRTQDLLFSFLGKGKNLFLVGDPKQSIYRFRGAEPSVFIRYKNTLPAYPCEGAEMQKIFLSHNFRCDPPVIRLTNQVFRALMDGDAPDSLYSEADALRSGKEETGSFLPAELVLVEKTAKEQYLEVESGEEESADAGEHREASYIASRIVSLLSGKEGKVYLPEEIAVICRTKNHLSLVREALTARGVECAGGDGGLWESGEYLFLRSLLETLDNPYRDIPLLGTLSSPVFCFSDDMLLTVRKHSKKSSFFHALCRYGEEKQDEIALRCREFLCQWEEWQRAYRENTLTAFLFGLYRSLTPELLYSPGDGQNQCKDFLLDRALAAEQAGVLSLTEFLNFLDKEENAEPLAGSGVRVMTIHKSKGLEFPVVFVSFLNKAFSDAAAKAPITASPHQGFYPLLPRLEGRAKYLSLQKKGLAAGQLQEDKEEEKRVLYVAMTRAKNKLILTASPSGRDLLCRRAWLFSPKPLSPQALQHGIAASGSLLEMLLFALREDPLVRRALTTGEEGGSCDFLIRFARGGEFLAYEKPTAQKNTLFSPSELLRSLAFTYAHGEEETLPKKLSVSELLERGREEEIPQYHPRKLLDFRDGKLKTNAAMVGTATHQVMQFIRFSPDAHVEQELERLTKRGFLSPEDMALVDRDAIRCFFASPLYGEMARSPHVEHERRFHVILSAKDLLDREGEVLVQGVVDAWFENPDGSLTLVDFKTDRVSPTNGEDVLRERHGEQLRLYRLAVETITGKKVSRLLLYSFCLHRSVEVPLPLPPKHLL